MLASAAESYRARASDRAFVSQLFRLTRGDPLLICAYLDGLLPILEKSEELTPQLLSKIEPGIESVFQLMYDEHRKTWPDPTKFPDRAARALLNACSTAVGPLTRSDLTALCPQDLPDSDTIEEAAIPWRRLLMGDGMNQGYVFDHPRLAESRKKKLTQQESAAWRERFLAYGRTTRESLAAGTLAPAEAPRYVVRYYSTHLAGPPPVKAETYSLLNKSWFDAWISVEGFAGGFLNDVDMAWQQAAECGAPEFRWIFHAALTKASVLSSVSRVFARALEVCLQSGVIDARRALTLSRQHHELTFRAACLGVTAPYVETHQEQLAIWREFLQTLTGVASHSERSFLLRDLGSRVPRELAAEAEAVALSIEPRYQFAAWLGTLRILDGRMLDDGINRALASASEDDSVATIVLVELSRRVSSPHRERVLAVAQERSKRAPAGPSRARALAALAGVIDATRDDIVNAAFEQARLTTEGDRGHAFRDVAAQLTEVSGGDQDPLLMSLRRYLADHERVEPLLALASKVRDEAGVDTVLQWLGGYYPAIRNEFDRIKIKAAFVRSLSSLGGPNTSMNAGRRHNVSRTPTDAMQWRPSRPYGEPVQEASSDAHHGAPARKEVGTAGHPGQVRR